MIPKGFRSAAVLAIRAFVPVIVVLGSAYLSIDQVVMKVVVRIKALLAAVVRRAWTRFVAQSTDRGSIVARIHVFARRIQRGNEIQGAAWGQNTIVFVPITPKSVVDRTKSASLSRTPGILKRSG